MDFNPHPGWIGWLGAALVVVAFTLAFIKQRKKKAADKLLPRPYRVPVDGFADVLISRHGIKKNEAQMIAHGLHQTRNEVWAKCKQVYGVTPKTTWIDKVMVTRNPDLMPKDHKHGYFDFGGRFILALYWDGVYEFFAHEIHNVFRAVQFGPGHIREPMDDADRLLAQEMYDWIEGENYR